MKEFLIITFWTLIGAILISLAIAAIVCSTLFLLALSNYWFGTIGPGAVLAMLLPLLVAGGYSLGRELRRL